MQIGELVKLLQTMPEDDEVFLVTIAETVRNIKRVTRTITPDGDDFVTIEQGDTDFRRTQWL